MSECSLSAAQGGNAGVKVKLLIIMLSLSYSHRYMGDHCGLLDLASDLIWAVFPSNKTVCSLVLGAGLC